MIENIWSLLIVCVTTAGTVAIAWMGMKRELKAIAASQVELGTSQVRQAEKMVLLEHNTNAIQHALLTETQENYLAKGEKQERDRVERLGNGDELLRLQQLLTAVGPATFLIIDDDEADFFFLQRALTGCRCLWAQDGAAGLVMLKEMAGLCDAVIVDEHLGAGAMAGHQVIILIKEKWPRVKTVLASGFDLDTHMIRALQNIGPIMLLSKPLRAAHLQNLLNWIQSSRILPAPAELIDDPKGKQNL